MSKLIYKLNNRVIKLFFKPKFVQLASPLTIYSLVEKIERFTSNKEGNNQQNNKKKFLLSTLIISLTSGVLLVKIFSDDKTSDSNSTKSILNESVRSLLYTLHNTLAFKSIHAKETEMQNEVKKNTKFKIIIDNLFHILIFIEKYYNYSETKTFFSICVG